VTRGTTYPFPPPENYAQHWCSLLTDPTGVFSACHSTISPAPFHSVRSYVLLGWGVFVFSGWLKETTDWVAKNKS
jgi:hypothetical protein